MAEQTDGTKTGHKIPIKESFEGDSALFKCIMWTMAVYALRIKSKCGQRELCGVFCVQRQHNLNTFRIFHSA